MALIFQLPHFLILIIVRFILILHRIPTPSPRPWGRFRCHVQDEEKGQESGAGVR